jgi:nucleoside-diphosphate-sugar epimerase
MKVLFIGGTGIISTAVSNQAMSRGIDLYLLNRNKSGVIIPGAKQVIADIRYPDDIRAHLGDTHFDAVVDWIAYTPEDIQRDLDLFQRKTDQYIFISSASAYQKPPLTPIVTESTPLKNPYWRYSQNKIACEELLMKEYREGNIPVTIIRPSLTYNTIFPIAIGGWGCYTLADRMLRNEPIIVHGDGSSLWTVTHAEDFGIGFLGVLGNPLAIGEAFHITSDEVLNWNQIYQFIADALRVKPKMVHIPSDFIASINPDLGAGLLGDKSWSAIFDNSKIKRYVPNYQAKIPFYEGARRIVAWFDTHPHLKKVDPKVNQEIDEILMAYQHSH